MNESLLTPITYRLIFAQNVRQIRRLKEISQEELAHLSGVSRIYIGEVERGKRNITLDVMARIAIALDISLEQLLVRDLMDLK
ncbi:helix-turn-helix domain-containing protein [Wielerella bovis]|uniref:helix-turn-helix domain-containing protein n=1 Tax=Wielerella bovis TaxID=2917790 RepID=UPI0020186868|nr:helix-turn-helix transcriptional regulator [Wielerella bovis]MCG7656750.1 helix-turn-helix transcriptional regulator [Wielerella bovis]MCG7658973.1 helix-turn-helix transcriptional regulator [Wielerella bovis]ULJ63226.1 helix-turn-helix transcriptional regulator [Wielerella bovis]ULJ65454.1 helix-turn-helix transcriptional regulator [Wielerella bovis]ULJ67799.1 helix-turn-helix transcriptional regulator [Wielerella bovis]